MGPGVSDLGPDLETLDGKGPRMTPPKPVFFWGCLIIRINLRMGSTS